VRPILHKVDKPLAILIHDVGPLLEVQELLLLAVDEALGDVVLLKSLTELRPRHLVVSGESGGEGRPPGTCGPIELLGCEQRLLDLGAAEEPELGLDHVKPIIGLQRIHGLNKHWRVHR
jgi:hypothetical protein